MDRIHYAGDTVLTGSDIAAALLEYARALAERDASATIDIPSREDDGSLGRSTFLLGPASQLVTDAEESEYDEVIDTELVLEFQRKTAALVSNTVLPDPEPHSTSALDELDL